MSRRPLQPILQPLPKSPFNTNSNSSRSLMSNLSPSTHSPRKFKTRSVPLSENSLLTGNNGFESDEEGDDLISSPRRLLDTFLESAKKEGKKSRVVEEIPFEIYQDGIDAATVEEEDIEMEVELSEEGEEDMENQRPTPLPPLRTTEFLPRATTPPPSSTFSSTFDTSSSRILTISPTLSPTLSPTSPSNIGGLPLMFTESLASSFSRSNSLSSLLPSFVESPPTPRNKRYSEEGLGEEGQSGKKGRRGEESE